MVDRMTDTQIKEFAKNIADKESEGIEYMTLNIGKLKDLAKTVMLLGYVLEGIRYANQNNLTPAEASRQIRIELEKREREE